MPPKILFFGGLIGGVLVLCTIGFFILLGMVLGGKSLAAAAPVPQDVAANPSAPAPDDKGNQGFSKPADVSNDDHVFGNRSAKVSLITYTDFQCPFCQRFHDTAERLVNENSGKVRLIYRAFPLSSIHPMAEKAAEAGECVASLRGNDSYWKFVKEVFVNQAGLSDSMLSTTAEKVGVSKGAFESCLKSGKFADKVKAMQAGGEKAGVQGTPATFVIAADGSFEVIPGAVPFEQSKPYVDRALSK